MWLPNRPYVYGGSVIRLTKKEFWGSIPQCDNSISVMVVLTGIVNSCKSKVCNLQYAIFAQKKISAFNVSMENTLIVHKRNTFK